MSIACTLSLVVSALWVSGQTVPLDRPPLEVQRLDHTIRPLAQEMHLHLDPAEDRYHGSVTIRVYADDAVERIRFHARDLTLEKITVEGFLDGGGLPFSVGEKGNVSVLPPEPLPAGEHDLTVSFGRPYGRKGTGIYKVERNGQAYLFTQMEPEYARTAFPCWDAPEFKIPWRMIVTVPDHCLVVANTPLDTEEPSHDGMKRLRFMNSRPMPSYLVALAVGPFETVDVDGLSVPGRIVTPRNQRDLTGEAVRMTAPLLDALETYFETPYPYRKLDQLAVPEFNYGAMENVGAVTYRDTVLLLDPAAITMGQRQRLAMVVAHELAHMWFGNLVTPTWWDDLWLNESFASWIALKMVRRTFPEFAMDNRDIGSKQRAMKTDALLTSHPVRNPVEAGDDMTHLFDALAYSKGMAVLNMIENWLGEATFRNGMVQYMAVNRWGNADAFDLADALDSLGDNQVNAIMESFITRAGVPLLRFEPAGERSIRVTQRRYTQYGIAESACAPWTIPISLAYGDGTQTYTQNILLGAGEQIVELEIPVFGRAGHWLIPDADVKGYYRWHLPPDAMAALAGDTRSTMSVRQRVGFLDNLEALLNAGTLTVDRYLRMLASFHLDPDPEVMERVVAALDRCCDELVPTSLHTAYGRYLSMVLTPMADKIGLKRRKGEDVRIEPLRSGLIHTLGRRSQDPRVLALATESASAYLKDPYSVDPALADTFLNLAARHGTAALFEQYVAAYETTADPIRKRHYLGSLGSFRNPGLMERARGYVLGGTLSPQDVMTIPRGQADTDENRRRVFGWVVGHYQEILALTTENAPDYFPWLVCGQSQTLLDQGIRFFADPTRRTPAMEDELEEVKDIVRRRSALQGKELDCLARFLTGGVDE